MEWEQECVFCKVPYWLCHCAKRYAIDCQRSAEQWANEYAKNDAYKWQAQWAANRARAALLRARGE